MTLSEKKTDGVIALEISGKIHAEASENLLKELNALIDRGERRLLVDFSGVDYINSAGLRALLMAAKNLNALSGRMVLATVPDLIYDVLRISGCTSHIEVYPSKEEAFKALKGSRTVQS